MAQTESKFNFNKFKFNSFKIVTIRKRIWESSMKLSIFSLKTETLLEFLRMASKLFHSIIVDGKKNLKNYVLS